MIGAAGELREDAARTAAELDRGTDARRRALGDLVDERLHPEPRAGSVGSRRRAIAPVRVEIDRQVLEEPWIRRIVGLTLDEQLREARRQIALEDRRDLVAQKAARIRHHDRQVVDDRIATAALADQQLARALERAHVDADLAAVVRVRSATGTNEQIRGHEALDGRLCTM